MEFNCQACGACCVGLDVPLDGEDAARFAQPDLAALTVLHQGTSGPALRLMRKGEQERCAALVGPLDSCRCCVYAQRPALCRELAPGSEHCLAARRRLGLSVT